MRTILRISVLCLCLGALAAEVAKLNRTLEKETVAQVERKVKKLVNSGVKMALPYMMSAVTEIQLSSNCTHGFFKLMRGVMDIRDWAIKMIDALGKPSAGILEGTATAMGDYDECLDIRVPKNTRAASILESEEDFRGQFCMVQIHIPETLRNAAKDYQAGNRVNSELANSKTFLRNLIKIAPRADIADMRLGVCIPSTCTKTDLQAILNQITKQVIVQATALRCETRHQDAVRVDQIIILFLGGCLLALVLAGSATEMILRLTSSFDDTLNTNNSQKRGRFLRLLLVFSVPNNTRRLMSFDAIDTNMISCVRGMKFMSVCLYVIVSTYATPHDFHFFKYRSVFHFYQFMKEWWFTIFANASVGVDTLFFLAGFQITYRLWKKNSKGGKVTFSVPKFISKWFIRFMLSQFLVISMFLCLPLVGSGPIWADIVTPKINNCRERWWLNALSINNFWSSNETCLSHTWIICCLTHLFLAASVLLWILSKWTAIGIFVNLIVILGSCVAIAMVTLINEMPPAPAFYFLSFLNLKTIWEKLFIQAYDHIAPFCMGILLAYFLATYPKLKLKKVGVVVGWCLAITCNLTVICGLYGYRHGETMEISLSAIYASIHRIGWALGIAWIVFACAYGYGGIADDILSWKLFVPMEKISNFIYLLHPLVIFLHGGQLRERMYMAHLDQAMYAAAYVTFTIALAACCYVCCYLPYSTVERWIWSLWKESAACDTGPKVIKEGVSTDKKRSEPIFQKSLHKSISSSIPH